MAAKGKKSPKKAVKKAAPKRTKKAKAPAMVTENAAQLDVRTELHRRGTLHVNTHDVRLVRGALSPVVVEIAGGNVEAALAQLLANVKAEG